MSRVFAEVFEKTKLMSSNERSQLAKALIYDLDLEENPEIEELWFTEVEKRREEMLSGKIKKIPFDKLKEKYDWL